MDDSFEDMIIGENGLFPSSKEIVSWNEGFAPRHSGVSHMVFPTLAQTLRDLFEIPEQREISDSEYIVEGETRLTFRETFKIAGELGSSLMSKLGVSKGDNVTICMRNNIEYIVSFIATTSIGAVSVPMNSWWTTQELEYGLNNSETKVVICDSMIFLRLKPLLDGNKIPLVKSIIICDTGNDNSALKASPIVVKFEDVLAHGKGKAMPEFPCHKDSNAAIMYTSGSTAYPKGVVLTHRNFAHVLDSVVVFVALQTVIRSASNQDNNMENSSTEDIQPAVLLTVPLFHATGLIAITLLSILVGRKIVIMQKWDTETALRLIEKEKITTFTGVPTMVLSLMNHPNFNKYDTSTLSTVGGGGAPPPPQMVANVKRRFKNASPGQGYGLTETAAFTTLIDSNSFLDKPNSCGKALPGSIIEIWDMETNARLPEPESIGKVMIKGAGVMKEYWRDPAGTAKAISPDGFFDSGDIGKLDSEGYLYILDRAKQLIIRGGENISTVEVESGVYNNPDVLECAAIGIYHPTLQEEVGIAIYPKPGRAKYITLENVREACSGLAEFKKPTHIFIYKHSLPRGSTAKIMKKQIKEEVNNGTILRHRL